MIIEHGGNSGSEATGGVVAAPIAAQMLESPARDAPLTAVAPEPAAPRYDWPTASVTMPHGHPTSSRTATSSDAEIGHGGMADVYLAHDRLLDRRVAVKVLSPEFARDPTNVERFRREARRPPA